MLLTLITMVRPQDHTTYFQLMISIFHFIDELLILSMEDLNIADRISEIEMLLRLI